MEIDELRTLTGSKLVEDDHIVIMYTDGASLELTSIIMRAGNLETLNLLEHILTKGGDVYLPHSSGFYFLREQLVADGVFNIVLVGDKDRWAFELGERLIEGGYDMSKVSSKVVDKLYEHGVSAKEAADKILSNE